MNLFAKFSARIVTWTMWPLIQGLKAAFFALSAALVVWVGGKVESIVDYGISLYSAAKAEEDWAALAVIVIVALAGSWIWLPAYIGAKTWRQVATYCGVTAPQDLKVLRSL